VDDVAAVLSGPRGRRFCAEMACANHDDLRRLYYEAAWNPSDEAGRQRLVDRAAPYSGQWWSIPAQGRVVATTRALPDLGATRLMLVEDELGWSQARVQPLRPVRAPRVYEASGPQAWVDLVNRYPLEVTRSRRHDWWRTTGRAVRWFVPDWQAVAADHDAVHLSVAAYLATPGRALELEGGATVVAGWDPDATFWLAGLLAPAGEPVAWERHDDGERVDGQRSTTVPVSRAGRPPPGDRVRWCRARVAHPRRSVWTHPA